MGKASSLKKMRRILKEHEQEYEIIAGINPLDYEILDEKKGVYLAKNKITSNICFIFPVLVKREE